MNQPQITPGQNGYMPMLEQRNWVNPWSGLAESDQAVAAAGVKEGAANLQNIQAQIDAESYPSFSNKYGAGSQEPFPAQQGDSQGLGLSFGSAKAAPNLTTSPGFNPWSIQGEANAR